jgi:hypothetical protein
MVSKRAATAILTVLVLQTGCSGVKEELGIGVKRQPDEFNVYSRAPLSMPPNFGLRPPQQGGSEVGAVTTRDAAKDTLLGRQTTPASVAANREALPDGSAGVNALLAYTGATNADPAIRGQVNRETTILAGADQSMTERLMFWRKAEPDYGTVVDAPQEAQRIRENQALGVPVADGVTPTIARKKRALLEGIFN